MSENDVNKMAQRPVIDYARRATGPRRFLMSSRVASILTAATTAVAATGGLVSFVAVVATPTLGASRSARLRCEQTTIEVNDVIRQQLEAKVQDGKL